MKSRPNPYAKQLKKQITLQNMHLIIWEYRVKKEYDAEFVEAYGPDGLWAELFRQGEGYLETRFFRDTADLQRYLTIDYWRSAAAHDAFKKQWAAEYNALDQRCDRLTESETWLGTHPSPEK
jgi:heme-degrading monooxygenase HmoA